MVWLRRFNPDIAVLTTEAEVTHQRAETAQQQVDVVQLRVRAVGQTIAAVGRRPGFALSPASGMRSSVSLTPDLHLSRLLLISDNVIGHGLAGITVVVSAVPFWVKAGFSASVTLTLVRFG